MTEQLKYEFYEEKNAWICSLCFQTMIEVGELGPGFWLGYDKGTYAIIAGQGHKGHDLAKFSVKPWPDPDPKGIALDEETIKLEDAWLEDLEIAFPKDIILPAYTGWALVETCRDAGFGTDGRHGCRFETWLFDKCGLLLKAFETEHGDIEKVAEARHGNQSTQSAEEGQRPEVATDEGLRCPAEDEG